MKSGNIIIRRAFTLAEILLAIAMIAAVSAVTAALWLPDSSAVEDSSAESVLKKAIAFGRAESAKRGEQICMYFDSRGFFVVSSFKTRVEIARIYLLKSLQRRMESESEALPDDFKSSIQISFFARDPEVVEKGSIEFPDGQLKEIRFSPDSAMTPFYAVLSESDNARKIYFDTFSGDEDDSLAEESK